VGGREDEGKEGRVRRREKRVKGDRAVVCRWRERERVEKNKRDKE